MVLTLTRLIGTNEPGNHAGRCYLCGEETATGHREPPSDAFTAWASVYGGSVLCGHCYAVLHDRRFRARSWLATQQGVRFAESGEGRSWLRDALISPPEPPFALYLTRAGKKQGWISLIRYVSQSRDRFWVGTDWLDRPVQIDRAWVITQLPLLDRLAAHKVGKTALMEGIFSPTVWKRAIREGWTSDLQEAQVLAGDPRWEVVVYACYT